jgi:hypothetical protein
MGLTVHMLAVLCVWIQSGLGPVVHMLLPGFYSDPKLVLAKAAEAEPPGHVESALCLSE